jgi:iron complex outermembrane receptor protein
MRTRRLSWVGLALLVLSELMFVASATAQPSTLEHAMLEEVVVTARRREESLQDLPLSIAAVTADVMQSQGVYNIEDVGELVPNLTLTTSDTANNTRIVIRGIGGGHPDPVFAFGTGMYIDGHYIPNQTGGFMSTLDVERIEVLRGPQGTLFGKNSTGGAVNIITEKPSPEFEASALVRGAEWGQEDLRGMLNVPLTDKIYARVSAASEVSDGYYFNRNLGEWMGGRDLEALTGALRFLVGEHWTVDTTLSMAKQRDDDLGGQCTPAEPWPDAFRYGDPGQVQTHASCEASMAAGPFVHASDKRPFSHIDQEGIFVAARWDSDGAVGALDALSVRTSGSYRYVGYDFLQERDWTEFQINALGTMGENPFSNRTRNFEVVLEADVNDRLDFVVGANYFDEDSMSGDETCYELFNELYDPVLDNDVACEPFDGLFFESLPFKEEITGTISGGPRIGFQNVAVRNQSTGVFGHLTYAIADRWEMEAGLRYTEDDRSFHNIEFSASNFRNAVDPTDLGIADAIMNGFTVLENGFYNEASDVFSETTPMVSFARRLDAGPKLDSGMVYFLYSEGFLTGGFNTEINVRGEPLLEPLQSFGPEHVSNYEVGFKSSLLSDRIRLNSALFLMDYTDKQDMVTIDNSDGRFGGDDALGVVQNASEVEIYGFELELRTRPWDGGFVTFDVGYLHNEYSDYSSLSDADLGDIIDLSTTNIADFSPEWTVNAAVEHRFVLGNGGVLTPMVGLYWQSEYEWLGNLTRDSPPSFCFQGDYGKWRTRLTYEAPAANYQIALFGYNITDELIYERCGQARGLWTYRHERPETWGLEFTMRWGE